MNDIESVNNLISLLKSIQGISKKTAEKIVEGFILKSKMDQSLIVETFRKLTQEIKNCEKCGNITDREVCEVCSDDFRENKLIIVDNHQVITKFEKDKFYGGYYLIWDIDASQDLEEGILESYLNKLENASKERSEVILALSPTIAGEINKHFIKTTLRRLGIQSSELAIGIPMGANVDYIDSLTLKQSFLNRVK
ncbi:recombination protein RecR [Mycoplasma sp. Ms02]|uniref:recombination protein RecR n=1 Tax=Mycoplasma sp. Ms02 TaxID=353851 RepID=UPI001C89545D|nr:recombination protein RecR [Mycoplasma sp. Ms02]QZE12618.1 recombination protein RecR [Mycoplasma sp. Ms02]